MKKGKRRPKAPSHAQGTPLYGLCDTVEKLWMGDDNGPLTYGDLSLARLAAQTMNVQLGHQDYRIRATPYDNLPKVHKDKVDGRMSTLEAYRHIEDGGL